MPYRPSTPLRTWLGPRRATIRTLQVAQAAVGRPSETARPLAHAYVLRVVAEFQAFTRDLHDLTVFRLAQLSGACDQVASLLVTAMTAERRIDRGNADLRNLATDFRRLGVEGLSDRIGAANPRWSSGPRGDQADYSDLVRLRNCLAHANERRLDDLRGEQILDTVSWTRARLPGLDRIARALDRIVWDHLSTLPGTSETEPW